MAASRSRAASAISPESSAMINPLKNARAPTIAAIAAGRIV